MKAIVFDSGPIISLTMNNLLWLLEPLKRIGEVNFYITNKVKRELVDTPLYKTKRFKFEALQVLKEFKDKVLEFFDRPTLRQKTMDLLELTNNMFFAHGKNISIVQFAEIEVILSFEGRDQCSSGREVWFLR